MSSDAGKLPRRSGGAFLRGRLWGHTHQTESSHQLSRPNPRNGLQQPPSCLPTQKRQTAFACLGCTKPPSAPRPPSRGLRGRGSGQQRAARCGRPEPGALPGRSQPGFSSSLPPPFPPPTCPATPPDHHLPEALPDRSSGRGSGENGQRLPVPGGRAHGPVSGGTGGTGHAGPAAASLRGRTGGWDPAGKEKGHRGEGAARLSLRGRSVRVEEGGSSRLMFSGDAGGEVVLGGHRGRKRGGLQSEGGKRVAAFGGERARCPWAEDSPAGTAGLLLSKRSWSSSDPHQRNWAKTRNWQ